MTISNKLSNGISKFGKGALSFTFAKALEDQDHLRGMT